MSRSRDHHDRQWQVDGPSQGNAASAIVTANDVSSRHTAAAV